MNCRDVRGAILAGETGADIDTHLGSCAECRNMTTTFEAGGVLLGTEAMWIEPSDDLENRIVEMLVGDGAAGSDEPIPLPAAPLPPNLHAVVVDDEPPPGPIDREPSEGRSRTPNLLALLGVAAVLIAGFLIIRSGNGDPDWTVEVGAGPAAPTASATVDGWVEDGGTRMVLNARDLGAAPDGFFYEMWLSDGPLHVSGGTFTGTTDIQLFVGVSRADFPRVWVTLEPIDEDESPSTDVVLDTG